MIKKRCQIHAITPLTCFSVPIVGDTELKLTPDEIYKCICGKAEVSEILDDGTIIPLNFTNYDKDNSIKEESEDNEVVIEVDDKVEIEDETDQEKEADIFDEPLEDNSDETEEEPTVIETSATVKEYQVASRNNGNNNHNHKKSKNNKKH